MREATGADESSVSPPDPPRRPPRFGAPPPGPRVPGDRGLGLALSLGLHVALLALLLATDAVRLPDLASLLAEPEAAGGGERVLLLPIDGFPGARTSATPSETAPAATPPLVAPRLDRTGTRDAEEAPAGPSQGPAPAPSPGAGTPAIGGSGSGSGVTGRGDGATDRFNQAVQALRPRLLAPPLRPGELDALRTDHERAALRAYARIRALNDSIMAEIEAGRRATDWTWTDDQGRRWGISPGRLHLGGISIPLPISTTGSREDRELMREWQEIQAQSEQGAIDETFDERVEAIRARRDAERREE